MDRMEVIIAGAHCGEALGVKIIQEPELAASGNVCAMRNAAIRASQSELVIHCDDDILFTPGYWQAVSPALKGDWDILCTRLLNPNGTRYWDWAAYYPEKGQTLLPYDVDDPFVYATGGHAIYRRSVFNKIHWNENIRHGTNEEFDLAAQGRLAGLKFSCCPTATVYLQYPHCDALATVTKTPSAPPEPNSEFEAIIRTVESDPFPQELSSRVKHKLVRYSLGSSKASVDVSILVCCYRYLHRFRVFAHSICRQDYDLGRVEVMVANPQSPDGLSEYLALLDRTCAQQSNGRRCGPVFTEVLVDEKQRHNRGYLIQRAFEHSHGAVTIGMDCDLVLPKDFLSKVVATVQSNPDRVVGVYRNFLSPTTTEAILAGIINPEEGFAALLKEDFDEEQGYRGVLGYCQALMRSAWKKVGYPEEFDRINHSDVSFIERLQKHGIHPLFLREISILHLNHTRNWNGTQTFL